MKRTIPSILYAALVFVLAFSMFGVFMPASPVEAADLKWSQVNNPNSTGTYATFVIAQTEIIDIEVCSDGTMFAAIQTAVDNDFYSTDLDAGEYAVLKSTNGGTIWSPTGFVPTAIAIVDIAASPDYDSDTTLWVALANACLRTINGGTTFGTQSWGTIALGAATLTSIDVAPDYNGTGINIVVGTTETAGHTARVLLYKTSEGEWLDLATGIIATPDAAFVTFSPLYESDGEIIAVVTNTTASYVQACFSERDWNTEVKNATIGVASIVNASIAFPSDYDSISTNNIFVGIDSGLVADAGDVYRIIGQRPPEAASIPIDLNCHSAGTYDIGSIEVSGTIAATPTVIVGSADSAEVRKTANPLDTTPSWKTDKKGPTGTTATTIALATDFASSGVMYAATCGADSSLVRSSDSGSIFNGIALIDTVIVTIADVAAYDADKVFMITDDGAGTAESLWRTTNGGKAWERVYSDIDLAEVKLSPAYATDSTLYVSEAAGTSMWKSSNGGDTITGVAAKDAIVAFAVIDGSTVITSAADNKIYKTTNSGLRWTTAKTLPTQVAANFAVSPNYKNDSTILLGTAGGRVYSSTDGGTNFKRLGTSGPGDGTDAIYVAFDPKFESNGMIYAGSANAGASASQGLSRWDTKTSSSWDLICGAADLLVGSLVCAPNGVLYASNCTPSVDEADEVDREGGIERTVNPMAPLAYVGFDIETVTKGMTDGVELGTLVAVGSPTTLFAIDDDGVQLLGYKDTLSSATTITSPKDGASVPKTSEVTLTWAAITGALTYDYQYAVNADYSNKTNPGDIDGTSVVVPGLEPGTKYYWRVRSATPVISPWAKGSFITSLAAPVLTSPQAFEDESTLKPAFAWNAVPGAEGYELQVSDNPFYGNAWVKKPLSHTVWMWEDEMQYATTYYWRVKAFSTGTESKWTEATFTTKAEPTAAEQPDIIVQPPVVNIPAATSTPVVIPTPIASGYLWAIIVIGAVLVIAMIVLIVRTRRVV